MNDTLRKIPFLSSLDTLRTEDREHIEEHIQKEAQPNFDYFVLHILSAIIVTLGLIIDSEAVVIGGMLISPLFWPIIALALAMMEGKKALLTNSIYTLIRSFVIAFGIGFLFGLLTTFKDVGNEVIVHTETTIFELLIAIAAGLGGAFTVVYSKKAAAALFGVAIAIALVPPISAAGVLAGNFNFEDATGALLLFSTNFLAILLTSSLVFFVAKFTHVASKTGEERRKKSLGWAVSSFIIILIPIVILTWNVINDTVRQDQVNELFAQHFPNQEISRLVINKQTYAYTIRGSVYSSAESLPRNELQTFVDQLSSALNKPVNLDLQIIPYREHNVYSQ